MAEPLSVLPIIERYLKGTLSRDEAVREMLPLAEQYPGLAVTFPMTPEQRVRINELGQALSWEMAKKSANGRVPDVPYGSPEWKAFVASIPRASDEPR